LLGLPGVQPQFADLQPYLGQPLGPLEGHLLTLLLHLLLPQCQLIATGKHLRHPHLELRHGLLIKIPGVGGQIGKSQTDFRIRQRAGSNTHLLQTVLGMTIPLQPGILLLRQGNSLRQG